MADSVADKAGNSRVHIKTGVKFPVDVHEPDIIISKSSDSSVDVNIGFLQKDHRYEISFSVYDDVGSQVKVFPEQHFCIKLLSVYPQQSGDGHDIVMELITRKDGVMQEEFQLINETDENRKITVIIHARILGKHKGTPLLKEGIRCIGMEAPEDDSEASDWAGFD